MCLPVGMTGSEWRLWGGFLKKVAPGESEMRESQGQRLPWEPIPRGRNLQWDRQKSGGGRRLQYAGPSLSLAGRNLQMSKGSEVRLMG